MLKFNGKELTDFNIDILSDLTFSAPAHDVEFMEVPGVDGDIAISNNRLKSFDRSFPFVMRSKTSIEKDFQELSDFLKQDDGWHDLEWIGSDGFVYQAMYHEQVDLGRIVNTLGKGVLNFRMKPVKHLKTSLVEVDLGSSINNPYKRTAKPKLTIKGSGNMTINIGSSILKLQNIDGGVIVDSKSETITDLTGKRSQYDKLVSYPFPVIGQGNNIVTKTGSITSIKIIPRLEVVAT